MFFVAAGYKNLMLADSSGPAESVWLHNSAAWRIGYMMAGAAFSTTPELSVIIPFCNEEEALPGTLQELREALDQSSLQNWEAICVDDGSRDNSAAVVREFMAKDSRFRLIKFTRNCGQTAALDAGLRAARGELTGTMDADGQNDPHDFPRLIQTLRERKLDVICGIRQKRQDDFVRKISSRIANGFRNWITHETVTDVGCAIRVFRRSCFNRIKLYEGMHRFLPTLFRIEGCAIDEIPVNHRPRTRGKSKYGIHNRLWRGLKDSFAVKWMQGRALHYEIEPQD